MAKELTVQVSGGERMGGKTAETVAELKRGLDASVANYQATVNGEPVEDTHVLSDFAFVALTAKVKGA